MLILDDPSLDKIDAADLKSWLTAEEDQNCSSRYTDVKLVRNGVRVVATDELLEEDDRTQLEKGQTAVYIEGILPNNEEVLRLVQASGCDADLEALRGSDLRKACFLFAVAWPGGSVAHPLHPGGRLACRFVHRPRQASVCQV